MPIGLAIVLGVVSVLIPPEMAAGPRLDDVSMIEATAGTRQSVWFSWLNPLVGGGGSGSGRGSCARGQDDARSGSASWNDGVILWCPPRPRVRLGDALEGLPPRKEVLHPAACIASPYGIRTAESSTQALEDDI